MTAPAQAQQPPKTPAQQAWDKHWPFTRAAPELVRQVQREQAVQRLQALGAMDCAPF